MSSAAPQLAKATVTDTYYDILLLGRTGQGKSTLGNKLLKHEQTDAANPAVFTKYVKNAITTVTGTFSGFFTADNIKSGDKSKKHLSVTKECELLANESTKVRVLDTPGFADSEAASQYHLSVFEANLQIFRWLVREQLDPQKKLSVRRILYFVPVRGVMEKADGVFQEELQVMYHYFGASVFDCMIIIATNHRLYQSVVFNDDMITETKDVFRVALNKVTKGKVDIACPPVVYVGLDDKGENLLSTIKGTRVIGDANPFVPKFEDDTCSNCSMKTRYSDTSEGKRIVGIINPVCQTFEDYNTSKCHPFFIPKHTEIAKVVSGLGHIITFGVPLVVEAVTGVDTWPGFTNSDEICPHCKRPPGSKGCCQVLSSIEIQGEDVKIDHTSKVAVATPSASSRVVQSLKNWLDMTVQ